MLTKGNKQYHSIDLFKFIAAFFVITVHANPLADHPVAGGFLKNSVARIFLMFFFLAAGYLFFDRLKNVEVQQQNRVFKKYLARLFRLWLIWSLLYIPFFCLLHLEDILRFNLSALGAWMREIIFVGSFYHLWFLGALLVGIAIVYAFYRVGLSPAAGVACSAILYLIGLLGNSYDFLLEDLPALERVKDAYLAIFLTTRNGVFCAPLFLSLGWLTAEMDRLPRKAVAGLGLGISLLAGLGETALLTQYGQDSLELLALLPVSSMFLFWLVLQIPLKDRGIWRRLRTYSTLIYLVHPMVILVYSVLGSRLGISAWYGVRYCFVAAVSMAFAVIVVQMQKQKAFSWLKFFY